MIARLTGTIDELKPTEIILNAGGVGYLLQIPLSTFEEISALKKVTLQVYTLHREDQFRLFGFYTEKEKELFSILLGISGIGPAMALSLLSGITVNGLIEAVQSENTTTLVKIPGIGKSKAEKLIFEMKRKIKKLEKFSLATPDSSGGSEPLARIRGEAVEALCSLGFDEKKSTHIVDAIRKENPDASLEALIKESLKQFSS